MFTLKYFVNICLLLCQCGAFLAEKFLSLTAELLVLNELAIQSRNVQLCHTCQKWLYLHIQHQEDPDNGWHEPAYPVIIWKSYDHFGMVVHSQTLHIEITTECWYSPLEIGHLESRRRAAPLADTLLRQLASWIAHFSDMINLFHSSVQTIRWWWWWRWRRVVAYLMVDELTTHGPLFKLIPPLPLSDLRTH